MNQVSHELKTPLTNIRMYAELLAEQLQDGETARRRPDAQRRLSIIVSESGRLSRLIGNVLTFAQQQRRQIELKPAARARLTTRSTRLFSSFNRRFRLKAWRRRSCRRGAEVSFDADAVEQILVNLFSNVEKYAAQGKRLDIASRQDGERTTILVSDAGPGVPPAERDRIFQPFYRISNRLEGPAGAGIGLSIARGLARLHKGDLRLVDSAAGAAFEVDLHTPSRQSPQTSLKEGES